MSDIQAPIPVYISRHQEPLPDGYGAMVAWEVGEPVTVLPSRGNPPVDGIIRSGMLWHHDAPVVDSPRGRGQWVYHVEINGEIYTPSPAQIIMRKGA